ncbi:glycosyltransferase family 4 protein [Mucilaginibacter lappiensis]|uniref:Glycosyltransferase involved in cell wall biosynthesis n=1 Tax=Mucilaginibacter lappiensis TaxID=354630 RepID=A0A841JA44_9SPHI|nr:glycosyltransferase family 4 protein [Mucilaginibacter lappiensis]MBB6126466.1 glycosyltransferase involved in cell wall biosynthesis [Mucilaginibacter lappiensis]
MKVLLLYDYPASPSGLATQGELLYKGLLEMGVEAFAVHCESPQEKEWYYRWFKPDVVVGIGYWGHAPDLILHPQKFGMQPVPWLVANGYIANYQDVLNKLPLILVTSNWVKEMYVRDGINGDNIEVLPVGCNTDTFIPHHKEDPKIASVREALGISPDELMLLTVGGDAASKGAQEVMQALALIKDKIPAWKYVCKVWPQPRTDLQNQADKELAKTLRIEEHMIYATSITSRNFMPYLINACDIYAAPSRLEGFGMLQVEANACEKPVIAMKAMGMLDTMVDGETALLANIGKHIVVDHVILGKVAGYEENHRVEFDIPRTVDYRANVDDIAAGLLELMNHPLKRIELGTAGRKRVIEHFDYRIVAKKFVDIVTRKLRVT